MRHIIYRVVGDELGPNVSGFGYLFIEEWRNGKLAWRTAATSTCSNGAVTCYEFVRTAVDDSVAEAGQQDGDQVANDPAEPPSTDTIIEMIDENGDDLADWVVLAGLEQQLYYSGGAKVEWHNGFKPEEGERVTAPNQYRFAGCRTARVLPEKSSLFVDPAVCPYYRKTGSLDPGEDFKPYPGPIVWMKGNEIGGGSLKCDIGSFNEDGTIAASCVKAKGRPPEATTFRFTYGWDHVVLDTSPAARPVREVDGHSPIDACLRSPVPPCCLRAFFASLGNNPTRRGLGALRSHARKVVTCAASTPTAIVLARPFPCEAAGRSSEGVRHVRHFRSACLGLPLVPGARHVQVVGLRMLKIAAGGAAAEREALRMVTEKIESAQHTVHRLALGASPQEACSTIAGGFGPIASGCGVGQ